MLLLTLAAALAAQPTPEAVALQRSIGRAIAAGAAAVALPAGDVRFNAAPLVVRGARSLRLAAPPGGVSRLWFSPGAGLLLRDCENVTVAGVEIGYDPLPYVHGTVRRVERTGAYNATVLVHVPNSSLSPGELARDFAPSDGYWPTVAVFDAAGRLRCGSCNDVHGMEPAGPSAPGLFRVAVCPNTTAVGDVVAAATRVGYTFMIANSTGVRTERLTVRSASYMAVTEHGGGGGHVHAGLTIASDDDRIGPRTRANKPGRSRGRNG